MHRHRLWKRTAFLLSLGLLTLSGVANAQTFSITRAEWQNEEGGRLRVEGSGTSGRTVTIRNAGNNAILGTDVVESGSWSGRFSNLNPVPCTVSAQQSGSSTVLTRNVSNAPANCGPVAGLPTLSIANVSQNEGNSGTSTMTFTVSLSAPAPTGGVTFNFATANGTATAGTTGSADYVATSGSRTIAAGSTTTTIPVTIRGDTTVEPNETFTVNITGATNTTNATASATGTIVNDDQAQAGGGNPGPSNKSINSTSQSCGQSGQPNCGSTDVGEQAIVNSTAYKVLAVNDLGMHCGDLDTRISSILPPFNVMRAVVVQTGLVPTKNPAGVNVTYSAASNPNDPGMAIPRTTIATGGSFKTNFWDIGQAAYDPFYPGTSTGLNPFAAPYNLTMPADQSLPMPDVEEFYLGSGALIFTQEPMPGLGVPYVQNNAKPFTTRVGTMPFFTNPNFKFGYTSNVNWITSEGIPLSAFDDNGRENPYPLMRVAAVSNTGTVLSTTDVVAPISGEASCQSCHASVQDAQSVNVQVPNGGTYGIGTTALSTVQIALNDPQLDHVPLAASVEWASDHNILKLHDIRNPTAPRLITGTTEDFPTPGTAAFKPVVCQTCHYTPALDLAQLGPLDGATGTLGNGRQQGNNQSMSRVMHNHHGTLPGNVFPAMPAPTQNASGTVTNQSQRLAVLDTTCYMCHPGKNTKCMRGAMANGNMLCQDCHGSMTDVGNDFSKNQPGGGFILAGDFYTNANTPRVPWANEPSCGSCHTGDAGSNLATTTGVIRNTADHNGVVDNIRLRQAYRTTSAWKPIVPTNKRFAEDVVAATDNPAAAGNPKLYRVSVGGQAATGGGSSGHNGIFCEACHGATHAEYPNANANANDNVAANQLQGHTGTIIECSTCHGANYTGNNLNGPHGMHPVGAGTSWANGAHENVVSGNNCVVCHGANATSNGRSQNTGTVLSRAAVDRTLRGTLVRAGQPVGCTVCH